MFVADDPDYMANGIQCKGVSPYDDRYSSAWKFSARLGLVLGHALKVWASRLLPLGQYPRMRVQQDDGLMCLLVAATLPKAVVPWHLGPASTPSVRKHSAERMELETYCAWLPAPLRVPMAQLHGVALPHGAETARRCVKHSLLERPGPKSLSPLQAQGLFGSRMGRFSTFCVSKVEKVSLSLSLSPLLFCFFPEYGKNSSRYLVFGLRLSREIHA